MSQPNLYPISPLKKKAKIAVISPAGSVVPESLDSTLDLIRSKGYEPVLGPNTLGNYQNGYSYSGTKKERQNDLNWALNDSQIDAVWATRGGYGCQHLLKGLNTRGLKKKPRWYIGYSDNTVIQSFLLKRGFPSIHGQTIKTGSMGVSKESYELIFDILKGKSPKYLVSKNNYNKEGAASGTLIGGNLALIYALLGSRYSFDFKDAILFIEDVGENFYSLDRMMMSLELAGVFSKIKGLVVGGMTAMGSETENTKYEEPFDPFAYELISELTEKYDFPALYGFPNGHIFENRPLIIGRQCKIRVGEKSTLEY